MKWLSHQITASSAWVVLGFEPIALPAVLLGAVVPDSLDFMYAGRGKNRQARFNRVHRKLSHFWLVYALCLAFCLYLPKDIEKEIMTLMNTLAHDLGLSRNIVELIKEDARLFLCAFFFGALAHLAGDMLTPSGVPLSPARGFKHRISFKLFSTGTMQEYIFTAFFVILCYALHYAFNI